MQEAKKKGNTILTVDEFLRGIKALLKKHGIYGIKVRMVQKKKWIP